MSAVNPFQPPRAEVSDVLQRGLGFQEPKVWSAKGRVGRLRYLAYLMGGYLVLLLAMAVLSGVAAVVGGSSEGGLAMVTSVIMGLGMIPFLILSILTTIQRCHDIGWSGWAVLLNFVPFVNLFVMLMWIFKRGDAGANEYGLPPTPNTRAVKLLSLSFPVVVGIGILAAVALPQYMMYKMRAQQAQQGQPVPTSLQGEASR